MKSHILNLRKRLNEYRRFKEASGTDTSIHINAIEIAVNLAQYASEKGRIINIHESIWFNADWELIQVLENSDWEDMLILYFSLKESLIKNKMLEDSKNSRNS